MPRSAFSARLRVATLAWLAAAAAPAFAQAPEQPLGELLDVIPLPEEEDEAEAPAPALPPPPPPRPEVRPGYVVPVDLPPSAATGEVQAPDELEAPDELVVIEELRPPAKAVDPAAEAAAAADRSWAELQEQRRQEVNEVEAPIVANLNAEMAARAEAEGRRFAEEQEAYRQGVIAREEEARRVAAEHRAAMEEHARRVAREQEEYRARVEACRRDRRRCDF